MPKTAQILEPAKSSASKAQLKSFIQNLDYQVFHTINGAPLSVKGALSSPKQACQHMEQGGVIFFPESPFHVSEEDRQFLFNQKQLESNSYKNVAYRVNENRVTGVKSAGSTDIVRLGSILKSFSTDVTNFLSLFLAPYANNWHIDYASFRPIEEKGRKLRLRARNDLIHVDSFPTRPTKGDRIMRCFVNLNPTNARVWRTSDPFHVLVNKFAGDVKAPDELGRSPLASIPMLAKLAKSLGFKSLESSSYDKWMLNFHNFLKENTEFQKNCRADIWEFPPNSAWIVMTDVVSHSVLSGQYAMEQTYLVSHKDMVAPDTTPINVLRKTYGIENID